MSAVQLRVAGGVLARLLARWMTGEYEDPDELVAECAAAIAQWERVSDDS